MTSEAVPCSPGGLRSSERLALTSVAFIAIGVYCRLHHVDEGVQLDLLLLATALLGAPHGVYDLPLLWTASGGRGTVLIRLTAFYIAMIAATAIGWLTCPAPTLILFLCMAVGHFGDDFTDRVQGRSAERLFQRLAGGLCIILPLLCLHPATIAPWVAAVAGLSPSPVAALLARIAPLGLGLWIVSAGGSLIVSLRRGAWRQAIDLSALAALFALTPPLLAFAAYFALSHSLRHVTEAEVAVRGWPQRTAWLVPAILVSTASLLLLTRIAGEAFAVLVSLRLLAALATPHLLLGPWLRNRATVRQPAAVALRSTISTQF